MLKTESFVVGKSYFIRAITFHYLGEVSEVREDSIDLVNASWVADSGVRLGKFLMGERSDSTEIEPFPRGVTVRRDAIIDWSPWNGLELPKVAIP